MSHIMDINGEDFEKALLEHIDQDDEWLATTAEIVANKEEILDDELEELIRESIQSELDSYTDMIVEHLKDKLREKYLSDIATDETYSNGPKAE